MHSGTVARAGGTLRRAAWTAGSGDRARTQGAGRVTRHEPLREELRGRVPMNIWNKTRSNLHLMKGHPLNTLREAIEEYMERRYPSTLTVHSDLSPIVTTKECFDDLLVPCDHVSRRASDTYYIDDGTLLRTHMTAHDPGLLRDGVKAALTCGDVYRRDSIDRTHYPVFHQVDGYRLYDTNTSREEIENELKSVLEQLARRLFGMGVECKWTGGEFPFTSPSFELEVLWKGSWLEVLGCGLLERGVLQRSGVPGDVNGWAFGLGLERLAMVLFDIPDIRLFWSCDERFLAQFADGDLNTTFTPFSVFPPVEKHVAFWVDSQTFHENDFHQLVRATCGDLVESVRIIDTFRKEGRVSLCFAIVFRSMDKSLTHSYVNQVYEELRCQINDTLPVTLR